MEGRGFSNPVDLAISSESQIYVVSRTNTLQTFGMALVQDAPERNAEIMVVSRSDA